MKYMLWSDYPYTSLKEFTETPPDFDIHPLKDKLCARYYELTSYKVSVKDGVEHVNYVINQEVPCVQWHKKDTETHWSKLINAESPNGTWDWFNPIDGTRMKLLKFIGNETEPVAEVDFSVEEWEDLIKLVKRIS